MYSLFRKTAWVAGPIAFAVVTPWAEAGLTYVRQTRVVEADAGRILVPGGPAAAAESEAAADFSPFSGHADAEFLDYDEDSAAARATQSSSLTGSGISASGVVAQDLNLEPAFSRSMLEVIFEVDRPQAFTLAYDVDFPENVFDSNTERAIELKVALRRLDGGAAIVSPGGLAFPGPDPFEPTPDIDFTRTGTLEPGRYELLFDLIGRSTYIGVARDYQAAYELRLTAADAQTPPAHVPLPAAAWMALSTLGAVGAAGKLRQCRRRREDASS